MRSASSSSVSNGRQEASSLEVEAERLCFCGIKARMRTSRTEGNPGRRFFGCPRYSSGQRHLACGYFEWIDEAVVHREEALPALMRKVKMLEDKVKISEDKEKISEDKLNIAEDKVKTLQKQVQILQQQLLKQKAKDRLFKAGLLASWMFFGCVLLFIIDVQ